MASRNFDFSQTPSDSILIFPDVPVINSPGFFLGAVTATTGRAQLSFFNPGTFYVPAAGGTMTGPLILWRDPVSNPEAATKQYADTKVALAGGQMTGLLGLSGDPTLPLHASTKQYADTKVALTGGTMTGLLTLSGDPVAPPQAATRRYVDAQITSGIAGAGTLYVPLVGGTMTGPLTLAADPAAPLQPSTKQYSDTKLALAGGTLTGLLTLSGPPTNPLHAATKAYADAAMLGAPYLPIGGGTLTGPYTDVGGSAHNVLTAATPPLIYAWADAVGNIAGGFTPDGSWRIGKLSFTTSDGGRFTAPVTDAGGSITSAADVRVAGVFQYAWADPAGVIAMEILPDGTVKIGNLSAVNLSAANISFNSLVVPQITIGSDLFAPLGATVPGKFALADPSGALALLLDNNGILRARTLSGYTLDAMATMPQVQQAPQLGFLASRYVTGTYGTNGSPGNTWHTTIALEGDFDAVRLVYLNDGTSGSFTVTSAVLAVTASASDPLNPVDGTGAAAPWMTVTFTNGGVAKSYWEQTQAQPQPAPVTAITLNNAVAGGTASGGDTLGVMDKAVTYSDWIPLSSFQRSDGTGKFPLLMVRHYCGSGTPRPTGGVYTGTAWDNASNGRVQHNYTNPGDCITSPGAFTSTTPVSSMIFAFVQVLARARTLVGMIVGDSLSQGTGTTSGLNSFLAQAFIQLSTPALPMQVVASAFGGMPPNDYFFNGHALLDQVRPNLVVIQISGRGGGTYATPAAARACWTRALEFARRARALGAVPVFYAPPPDSSETTVTDPNRLLINSLALEAGQQGTFVVDGSALLGLPGNPMTLDPRYTNEGVHPNDAGHAVMAAVLVPMIKKMFGI